MAEEIELVGAQGLLESVIKSEKGYKIASNGLLYVYAKMGGWSNHISSPVYNDLNPEAKEKTWFPIERNLYENALKTIDEMVRKNIGFKDVPTDFFPESDGINQFMLIGCLVKLRERGFSFTTERHHYIGISSEPNQENRICNLAFMLGLPPPFA